MAQKKNTKGAMGKDPSLPETSKRGNWKYKGKWVNKEGFLVDNYGKVLPNQKNPFVAAAQNPFAKKQTNPNDTKQTKPVAPTAEERINTNINNLVESGAKQAGEFNPETFVQDYNPQFNQTMQDAYDRIYGQFEQKNQERFARENDQLQQSLVERGLDPNSPAYQALTRQLAEQQNTARQDAQNAAWQSAQGYQQQIYNQASGAALLPSQIASPYLNIYGQGQQLQFTGTEAEKQRKWQEEQARLDREQRERLAKRQGGGGGQNNNGAEIAAYIMNRYGSGQQGNTTTPATAATTGVAQGTSAAVTNRLLG
jgi:hypothetical protein